ncbi:hypothetical protein HK099_005721 [Clydaea vesicula]|uniref:Uncharacterized protein n=1 Tax=Clydaea vesicula TaxID=447962 RepID=A0AAD5U6H4_9FUNG|nr:hypothetical protein HK099_005721 [Clydaea vesicula]KAJ3385706.1 hypothetical protein HDU92_002933 [Lobulomyces angularis]
MNSSHNFLTSSSYNKDINKEQKLGEHISTAQASYKPKSAHYDQSNDHYTERLKNQRKANIGNDWWGNQGELLQFKSNEQPTNRRQSVSAAKAADHYEQVTYPSHYKRDSMTELITGSQSTHHNEVSDDTWLQYRRKKGHNNPQISHQTSMSNLDNTIQRGYDILSGNDFEQGHHYQEEYQTAVPHPARVRKNNEDAKFHRNVQNSTISNCPYATY